MTTAAVAGAECISTLEGNGHSCGGGGPTSTSWGIPKGGFYTVRMVVYPDGATATLYYDFEDGAGWKQLRSSTSDNVRSAILEGHLAFTRQCSYTKVDYVWVKDYVDAPTKLVPEPPPSPPSTPPPPPPPPSPTPPPPLPPPPPAPPFGPCPMGSSLVLWLDASDASTITTDANGKVRAWADKGCGVPDVYAIPSYSSNYPSMAADTPASGRPVIELQNSPMQIRDAHNQRITRRLPQATVFMVVDPDSSYAWYWCFGRPGFYGTHIGIGALQRHYSGSDCRVKKYLGLLDKSFYDGRDRWDTPNPAGCDWMVIAWTVGPNTNKMFINGVLHKDDPAAYGELAQPTPDSSFYSWVLGGRHDNAERFSSLKIGETKVYNEEMSDESVIEQSLLLHNKWLVPPPPPSVPPSPPSPPSPPIASVAAACAASCAAIAAVATFAAAIAAVSTSAPRLWPLLLRLMGDEQCNRAMRHRRFAWRCRRACR